MEKGDEEGKLCDLNPAQPIPASAPAGVGGVEDPATVQAQAVPVSAGIAAAAAAAAAAVPNVECETELESICAAMESTLAPVWAEDVEGVSKPNKHGHIF